MDKLAALGEQLSQVTVYDLKTYYNQAKNIVLQVSEMEAKVLEATNEDAWGASSSLMQEIAQGTFNFQEFNQIMPTIYKRFMEKEAREWRQIYKALMLLEYLIKHGSERVVDDARSHVSTIKMLRNFHYIDEKGKDEGINGSSSKSIFVSLFIVLFGLLLSLRRSSPPSLPSFPSSLLSFFVHSCSPQPSQRDWRTPLGRRKDPFGTSESQSQPVQVHRSRKRRWKLRRRRRWRRRRS
ncbi:hypothetical protein BDY24DRAFT_345104 [Mrakia frigida]|uniref:ENTH domain-containing protein n=1 Tax=Mrakia frigida TaxID=29902 RepID=UPI003FCC1E4E